jgi:hypothetical protein
MQPCAGTAVLPAGARLLRAGITRLRAGVLQVLPGTLQVLAGTYQKRAGTSQQWQKKLLQLLLLVLEWAGVPQPVYKSKEPCAGAHGSLKNNTL